MSASPRLIPTEIFARLPDKYRSPEKRSAWLESRQHGAVHSFLEGPSFDRAGNLYCTDIPYGRIFKVTPDGEFHLVTEYDGEPNGLKIRYLGELLFRIKSCAGLGTTNLAYGGTDRKTLYITESATGAILRARMPVAGGIMYSHR